MVGGWYESTSPWRDKNKQVVGLKVLGPNREVVDLRALHFYEEIKIEGWWI